MTSIGALGNSSFPLQSVNIGGMEMFSPETTSTAWLDPNSIVAGQGLGAENIPQPPSAELTQQYEALVQTNALDLSNFYQKTTNDLQAIKETATQSMHMSFDTTPPQWVPGAETPEQQKQRQDWENDQQTQILENNIAPEQQMASQYDSLVQQLYNYKNPPSQQEQQSIESQMAQLGQSYQSMMTQQTLDLASVGFQGLTDPTTGLPATQVIQNYFTQYAQLQASQQQQEAASPGGQAWANYQQEMKAFLAQQYQLVGQQESTPQSYSANSMRTLFGA